MRASILGSMSTATIYRHRSVQLCGRKVDVDEIVVSGQGDRSNRIARLRYKSARGCTLQAKLSRVSKKWILTS
jgi:hypothetical protein